METKRIDINVVNPLAYKPLFELNNELKQSTLSLTEFYLIQIRASQINGCAFCIQMHVKDAIANGEAQFRLHALANWEETSFFSKSEAIILKITEEITMIHKQGLSQFTYEQAIHAFGEKKLADIIMAIVSINAWNRIGRATLLEPQPAQS